jgi:hypothetical protein
MNVIFIHEESCYYIFIQRSNLVMKKLGQWELIVTPRVVSRLLIKLILTTYLLISCDLIINQFFKISLFIMEHVGFRPLCPIM